MFSGGIVRRFFPGFADAIQQGGGRLVLPALCTGQLGFGRDQFAAEGLTDRCAKK
jgi:hypothetical protein